jgi:hypothetical protein
MYKQGTNVDDFGTVWKVTVEGRCGNTIGFPIADDWSNYDEYQFPPVFGASASSEPSGSLPR